MKELIVLRGPKDSGKTETLNLLIDMLKGINPPLYQTTDRNETIPYRGMVVSVCTSGDSKSILASNVKYFENNPSDICIAALRVPRINYTSLTGLATRSGVNIRFVDSISDLVNKDKVNMQLAQDILSML